MRQVRQAQQKESIHTLERDDCQMETKRGNLRPDEDITLIRSRLEHYSPEYIKDNFSGVNRETQGFDSKPTSAYRAFCNLVDRIAGEMDGETDGEL